MKYFYILTAIGVVITFVVYFMLEAEDHSNRSMKLSSQSKPNKAMELICTKGDWAPEEVVKPLYINSCVKGLLCRREGNDLIFRSGKVFFTTRREMNVVTYHSVRVSEGSIKALVASVQHSRMYQPQSRETVDISNFAYIVTDLPSLKDSGPQYREEAKFQSRVDLLGYKVEIQPKISGGFRYRMTGLSEGSSNPWQEESPTLEFTNWVNGFLELTKEISRLCGNH